MNLAGKRALVTGASGGIGGAFARRLAARGADLILTGRSEEKLEALASEIEKAHGRAVFWTVEDLTRPGGPVSLFERTEGSGRAVDLLVNNAGAAQFGEFLDRPWERVASELHLNTAALTELCYRFGRAMRDRRGGYILNVASIGSYVPAPGLAAYGAEKAYVLSLTEALAHELRPAGVRVCAVCPGAVRTAWWENAGQKEPVSAVVRAIMTSPEEVARVGLRGLLRGRRNVMVGLDIGLAVFFLRFLPRRLVVAVSAALIGEVRA